MESSPKEQRGRPGQSASGTLPNLADRPTARLPFRPVGAPRRGLAPSAPPPATPAAASLARRLAHLAQAAIINPTLAWLGWGHDNSFAGDDAADSAIGIGRTGQ